MELPGDGCVVVDDDGDVGLDTTTLTGPEILTVTASAAVVAVGTVEAVVAACGLVGVVGVVACCGWVLVALVTMSPRATAPCWV